MFNALPRHFGKLILHDCIDNLSFSEQLAEYEQNHGQGEFSNWCSKRTLWLRISKISSQNQFENVFEAIRKLKVQEPRLGHLEFEIEEHRKELKRIDKKNRSLADNQRQLELDKRVSFFRAPRTDGAIPVVTLFLGTRTRTPTNR